MADTTTKNPPPDLERLEREWRAYVADLKAKRTVPDDVVRGSGVAAVRDVLEYGPARVQGADGEWYIVMSEARYREICEELDDASAARGRETQEAIRRGEVYSITNVDEWLATVEAMPDEEDV